MSKSLTLMVALCLSGSVLASADTPPPRLITVTGRAELMVVPDRIDIRIDLASTSQSVDAAKARNDSLLTAFEALVRKMGVPEKDVHLDYVNIRKEYNWNDGFRTFREYKVSRRASVVLRDVDKFEAVLHGLVAAGVDEVIGVRLKTSDLREHRDKARIEAVRAAREKAEAMASELDSGLKRPYTIDEINEQRHRWTPEPSSNVMYEVDPGEVTDGTAAILGQIPVVAEVRVAFELM